MYAYIKGVIADRNDQQIVIENNGIGYLINCPLGISAEIGGPGDSVTVYLYQSVKEDDISLYGFSSRDQKEMFLKLITVSGIGPKVAHSICASLSAEQIAAAVMSNNVALLTGVKGLGKKTAEDHFFCFDIKNVGESTITAKAGECTDEGKIRKVDEMNMDYVLKEKGAVLNWFDITEIDGYFSLNDKMSDVMASEEGRQLFMGLMANAMKNHGDKSMMGDMGAEMMSGPMMQMMGGFTVIRLANLMGAANLHFTKEELLQLNAALNRIKK